MAALRLSPRRRHRQAAASAEEGAALDGIGAGRGSLPGSGKPIGRGYSYGVGLLHFWKGNFGMPIEYRERPRCRREVERILRERNCSLEDLLKGDDKHTISDGLQTQVRKMIAEKNQS